MQQMGYYETVRREQKEKICSAAKDMICKHGVANVTLVDLAKNTELSRQTLYKYYDNMDAIAFDIQKSVLLALQNIIDAPDGGTLSPLESIHNRLQSVLQFVEEHSEDILFVTAFDIHYNYKQANLKSEELLEDYAGFFDKSGMFARFYREVAKGQASGEIRRDKSPDELCVVISNTFVAVCARLALFAKNQNSLSERDSRILKEETLTMLTEYLHGGRI